MGFFDINLSGEPGMAIIAIVAFGAGLIRGFTGFGGPAFMLDHFDPVFYPLQHRFENTGSRFHRQRVPVQGRLPAD